jgi:hypothetical protein
MYTAGSPWDCSLEQKSINFLIGIDVVSLIITSLFGKRQNSRYYSFGCNTQRDFYAARSLSLLVASI